VTVGVAAVAGRDRNDRRADRGVPTEAIVLVADRRLTYSAGNTVAETWVPKIRGIIGQGATVRTTWSALFAGDGSLVDEIKAELTGNKANDALHEAARPALEDVAAAVSAAVETVWQRGYDAYVYQPFGLTRDLVVRRAKGLAPLPSALLEKVTSRGQLFDAGETGFGCDLALCGFDERERSAVLELDEKGTITRHFDTGFCAIGEGWDTATARLELLRYQPWMDLGTVLFFAIDAKLTAERVASVGPTTDAWVLLPHQDVPQVVDGVLVDALAKVRGWDHRRSAFQKQLPGEPPLAIPPQDWADQLWAFVKRCYAGAPAALEAIERDQPIWYAGRHMPRYAP
jgi:hypothetical protein